MAASTRGANVWAVPELIERLAGHMVLGALLEELQTRFGGYDLVAHWTQGEFHHDVVLKLPEVATDDLPGRVLVVATNCNGGIHSAAAGGILLGCRSRRERPFVADGERRAARSAHAGAQEHEPKRTRSRPSDSGRRAIARTASVRGHRHESCSASLFASVYQTNRAR
jgi:hypothetical protein